MSFVNITLFRMDAATITPVVVAPVVKGATTCIYPNNIYIYISKQTNKKRYAILMFIFFCIYIEQIIVNNIQSMVCVYRYATSVHSVQPT